MAMMIADPQLCTAELVEGWAQDLANYMLTDALVGLVGRTPFAQSKAEAWINSEEEWTVNPDQFFTRGKACPFDGWELTGKVMGTMVNGEWVYKDGEVQRAW